MPVKEPIAAVGNWCRNLARRTAWMTIFLSSTVLLAAACSGQPQATAGPGPGPGTAFSTPVATPFASACAAADQARQNVERFIERYNAHDAAGALSLMSTDIKQYVDPLRTVVLTQPTRADMESILTQRFNEGDTILVKGAVAASVDPVAAANQYSVMAKVDRVDRNNARSSGDLNAAVDCQNLKITLLALITQPSK